MSFWTVTTILADGFINTGKLFFLTQRQVWTS